jgi:hypothetical protein
MTVAPAAGEVIVTEGGVMSAAAAASCGNDVGSRLVLLPTASSEAETVAKSKIPKSKKDAIALRVFTIDHIEGIIGLRK